MGDGGAGAGGGGGAAAVGAPLVSIIIANRNGRGLLEECLSSLAGITYGNTETIVVDDGSSDGSAEFVRRRFPRVAVTELGENRGFAGANNAGAGAARGEILLFLNNDTRVTPGFLDGLVREIAGGGADICQSLLLRPDGTVDSAGDFIDARGVAFHSTAVPEATAPILSARGACMAVRRGLFFELGGFDERFFASFEDVDMGWRAWIRGRRVAVVPGSVVYHRGSATVSAIPDRMKFHGSKNMMVMVMTNFEASHCARGVASLLLSVLARGAGGSPAGAGRAGALRPPSPGTALRAAWWIARNLPYVCRKRGAVRAARRVPTSRLKSLNLIAG